VYSVARENESHGASEANQHRQRYEKTERKYAAMSIYFLDILYYV